MVKYVYVSDRHSCHRVRARDTVHDAVHQPRAWLKSCSCYGIAVNIRHSAPRYAAIIEAGICAKAVSIHQAGLVLQAQLVFSAAVCGQLHIALALIAGQRVMRQHPASLTGKALQIARRRKAEAPALLCWRPCYWEVLRGPLMVHCDLGRLDSFSDEHWQDIRQAALNAFAVPNDPETSVKVDFQARPVNTKQLAFTAELQSIWTTVTGSILYNYYNWRQVSFCLQHEASAIRIDKTQPTSILLQLQRCIKWKPEPGELSTCYIKE